MNGYSEKYVILNIVVLIQKSSSLFYNESLIDTGDGHIHRYNLQIAALICDLPDHHHFTSHSDVFACSVGFEWLSDFGTKCHGSTTTKTGAYGTHEYHEPDRYIISFDGEIREV